MKYADIPAEKLKGIQTLGELKAAGYEPLPIKTE
ncbi:MAG: hypothetical protein ACJASO_002522, partial [Cyclobacteriaceae bacterium]